MDLAADYASIVHVFQAQRLPAFISYTEEASARGIANAADGPVRVVVDVKNGKVVERSPDGAETSSTKDHGGSDAVTRYFFSATCYHATGERTTNWNGRAAIAMTLHYDGGKECDKDSPFTVSTLYADPQTREPLAAEGSESDEGVSVDISATYGRFGAYVMPETVSAHVRGHGWLFWVRERGEARYSNYDFQVVRRQSGTPGN